MNNPTANADEDYLDAETFAAKHNIKPENIIRFDFDPSQDSESQLQAVKEIIDKIVTKHSKGE